MTECLFCKIGAKKLKSQIIYETDKIIAFLDIKPVNQGHVLVMPRAHYANFTETPDDVLAETMSVAKKVAAAAVRATDAEGFNIGINNGAAAGQVIMHAHVHVIPRFKNDGLVHWKNKNATDDELNSIQQKILVQLL